MTKGTWKKQWQEKGKSINMDGEDKWYSESRPEKKKEIVSFAVYYRDTNSVSQ